MSLLQAAQEFNFHLQSGRVIFSQIFDLQGGTFAANGSLPLAKSEWGDQRMHHWIACPTGATAQQAFEQLLSYANTVAAHESDALASINNPCNDEFVKASIQQHLAGTGIAIKINDAV